MKRWSLFIDVEGFSQIYAKDKLKALTSLGALLQYVYRIGSLLYPRSPKRIFAHQLGDGVVIISDFPEQTLDRPISIAIALMQALLLKGAVARAGISHGESSDVLGCYPEEIVNHIRDHGFLPIGEGIMTIFQVMGDALINSYRFINKKPKGPCLFLDPSLREYIPTDGIVFKVHGNNFIAIDWISSVPQKLYEILLKTNVPIRSSNDLREILDDYIRENKLSGDWARNAKDLTL